MLAVVQPYSTASPDVPHRQRSSRTLTHNNLASSQPPSLPTAPSKIPTTTTTTTTATPDADTPFDIISYPPSDLLKLLANILTHIATTNDHLSPSASSSSSSPSHYQSHQPPDPLSAPPIWHSLTTAARNAISTPAATLTFHARNIPTISLEAYLLRILKYCPTSNHVFLSLLVYFDRLSKLGQEAVGRSFVIDSYNIHRLVIAGITVASKFFSDVFYTNSRYAKVGGLPLHELNQLELQFLLLNDFRLVVSSADMQDY
ncbi:cyclin-domain-containing protein, partial [Crepidotus variabilis]